MRMCGGWLLVHNKYEHFCVNDLALLRIFQRYRMPKYRSKENNRWHNEKRKQEQKTKKRNIDSNQQIAHVVVQKATT